MLGTTLPEPSGVSGHDKCSLSKSNALISLNNEPITNAHSTVSTECPTACCASRRWGAARIDTESNGQPRKAMLGIVSLRRCGAAIISGRYACPDHVRSRDLRHLQIGLRFAEFLRSRHRSRWLRLATQHYSLYTVVIANARYERRI